MNIIKTDFDSLYILKPTVNMDNRGYFSEVYNNFNLPDKFKEIRFIQDNETYSKKNVLRGVHFQNPPFSQTKLVRCSMGSILDVVVDIRKNSRTYGKYKSLILSSKNKLQLLIPRGFAHGFLVLSNCAKVMYKVDNEYSKQHENGIVWNDENLNIEWNIKNKNLIISKKDQQLKSFSKISNPF